MLADGRLCAVNDLLLNLWQEAGLAEPDVLDVYLHSLQDKLLFSDSAVQVQGSLADGWCIKPFEGLV